MRYILGAKPKDHTYLFDWIETSPQAQIYQTQDDDGTIHRYRYHNKVPLNDANYDLEVNFVIYEQISPKGKKKIFSWVTDIPLSEHTLPIVMKGGRARWRIENDTFNRLSNQGYNEEHNIFYLSMRKSYKCPLNTHTMYTSCYSFDTHIKSKAALFMIK